MKEEALVFDIKRNCSEDGPGIRTTVFFKGCPLSCVWCQNPEGISHKPSISFRSAGCHPAVCGAPCVEVCPEQSLRLTDALTVDRASRTRRDATAGQRHPQSLHLTVDRASRTRCDATTGQHHPQPLHLTVDRASCTRCDRCFAVCESRSLEPVGYWISVEKLLYRVLIDKPFFLAANGGVSLSGGEPTLQMSFVSRFLKRLKEERVHTALETCGFFQFERFRELVLPYLDLIYFDLKFIDDAASRRYTGKSNQLILVNFARLLEETGVPVVPRIPLIPGLTDTEENLSGLARFLRHHKVEACSLMSYNPLWQDKLEEMGLRGTYHQRSFMSKQSEDNCVQYFTPKPGGSPPKPAQPGDIARGWAIESGMLTASEAVGETRFEDMEGEREC